MEPVAMGEPPQLQQLLYGCAVNGAGPLPAATDFDELDGAPASQGGSAATAAAAPSLIVSTRSWVARTEEVSEPSSPPLPATSVVVRRSQWLPPAPLDLEETEQQPKQPEQAQSPAVRSEPQSQQPLGHERARPRRAQQPQQGPEKEEEQQPSQQEPQQGEVSSQPQPVPQCQAAQQTQPSQPSQPVQPQHPQLQGYPQRQQSTQSQRWVAAQQLPPRAQAMQQSVQLYARSSIPQVSAPHAASPRYHSFSPARPVQTQQHRTTPSSLQPLVLSRPATTVRADVVPGPVLSSTSSRAAPASPARSTYSSGTATPSVFSGVVLPARLLAPATTQIAATGVMARAVSRGRPREVSPSRLVLNSAETPARVMCSPAVVASTARPRESSPVSISPRVTPASTAVVGSAAMDSAAMGSAAVGSVSSLSTRPFDVTSLSQRGPGVHHPAPVAWRQLEAGPVLSLTQSLPGGVVPQVCTTPRTVTPVPSASSCATAPPVRSQDRSTTAVYDGSSLKTFVKRRADVVTTLNGAEPRTGPAWAKDRRIASSVGTPRVAVTTDRSALKSVGFAGARCATAVSRSVSPAVTAAASKVAAAPAFTTPGVATPAVAATSAVTTPAARAARAAPKWAPLTAECSDQLAMRL